MNDELEMQTRPDSTVVVSAFVTCVVAMALLSVSCSSLSSQRKESPSVAWKSWGISLIRNTEMYEGCHHPAIVLRNVIDHVIAAHETHEIEKAVIARLKREKNLTRENWFLHHLVSDTLGAMGEDFIAYAKTIPSAEVGSMEYDMWHDRLVLELKLSAIEERLKLVSALEQYRPRNRLERKIRSYVISHAYSRIDDKLFRTKSDYINDEAFFRVEIGDLKLSTPGVPTVWVRYHISHGDDMSDYVYVSLSPPRETPESEASYVFCYVLWDL
jgi:hypothetical protein